MSKYVQIVVDIPARQVDQTYSYSIPETLTGKLEIGNAVYVPFGRQKVLGFVVGFTDKPQIEKSKIKPVQKKAVAEKLFDSSMLKLFKWMASYYHSYLIQVIKTALPPGVAEGKITVKEKNYVRLNKPPSQIQEIKENIEKRAPKQAQVLETLLNNSDKKFTVSGLIREADCYRGAVYSLVKKNHLEYYNRIQRRKPFLEKGEAESEFLTPTSAQKEAIDSINNNIQNDQFGIFLLHGVTGSGKTEVYLNIIKKNLEKNKGAVVLVPEISLTPIMVKRFYSRFGEDIAIFHSNLSRGERYDEWRRLKKGEAKVVIGARSAIFAPVQNLGLIIIDEEHENSYKQSEYPHYHARRVAYVRGNMEKAPVVLGSATPSLESFYYSQNDFIEYLSLPSRINSKRLPPVEIVDMRNELKEGNTDIFSSSLKANIKKALQKGEQVLLFLNRRGYSSFMLCRECGHVLQCDNCDISLTYHADQNVLKCHYCDFTRKIPHKCPQCGSKYIRDFGLGTQKIEEKAREHFPEADIDRMDVDTTTRKKSHHEILKKLEKGDTDILVGTQMIAKGHDYPNISVVGVITADTILNLPDFRSCERTFQLLTQVAGRTGRGDKPGTVVVQTYSPDHYSIKAAKNHDYRKYYEREIELREELDYPPFVYLANIIISGEDEGMVINTATDLGIFLNQYRDNIKSKLGPSAAPLEKLRGKYRWQVILKFDKKNKRKRLLKRVQRNFLPEISKEIRVKIDVDPITML